MGRPTLYNPEVAESILRRIETGESLRHICEDPAMPARCSVFRWLDADPVFATKYALARERQADAMDDLILDTANETTPENAPANRVKIDAYKWRAEKLKPKVYGPAVTLKGDATNPLMVKAVDMSEAELLVIAAGTNRVADNG